MVNEKTLIKDVAGLITAADHFARSGTDSLFRYSEGVYVKNAEFFIRRRVKHILLELGCAERWSRNLAGEVIEFILLDVPELWERPSLVLINVQDGLLDIWTGELLPHSPSFLSTIRIPARFDSSAECPRIDAFLAEVFPPGSIDLAWEILGDLLTPDRSIQKAICLIGEGGNGKGVFSQLAANLVGSENVSHLSLQRLEQDRFAVSRLHGKLANICADLPSERLASSAIFKSLTGCDRITGERKYSDSFEFTPFARLLFSSNHLPYSHDSGTAYFDRWLLVPLEARFRGTRREIPRQLLDSQLSRSVELSGALNRALPALRRIRLQGRFTESKITRAEIERFRKSTDPYALWLEAETVSSPTALIAQEALYSAYALACVGADQPVVTRQMFGRKLKQLRPELQEAQRVLDGRRQWVYLGIGLRNGVDPVEHPIHSLERRTPFALGGSDALK